MFIFDGLIIMQGVSKNRGDNVLTHVIPLCKDSDKPQSIGGTTVS